MENNILETINRKYPVQIQEVKQITSEMFCCFGADQTYFTRITKYKTYEEQFEEITWTSCLSEHGVGVAPVELSYEKNLIEKADDSYIVVFRAAPGIHLPRKEWNAAVFYELGKQIGRMHRVTKEFEQKHPIKHLRDWEANEEYQFLKYIPEEQETIRDVSEQILAEIKKIPKTENSYGLIHGDIWLENVLVSEQKDLTIIDFQDCERQYHLFDLAVPIYSALEFSYVGGGNIRDYGRSIMSSLLEGYFQEYHIENDLLDQLPVFLKLKELFEYVQMHRHWKNRELTEEQVRILNHYRIRLENGYDCLKL